MRYICWILGLLLATCQAQAQTLVFSEDFSTDTAYKDRFDRGWSGEWNAGSAFGQARNDWHADHDMSCGNPNTTSRTIHLSSAAQAADAAFFPCIPGGDATKGHVMTTVNTEGYVTVWFVPKQTFKDVVKVCWDQNITDLGGGKWTIVNFLTPAEFTGKTDLGYTSPDFPGNGGPSSPAGPAKNGVKIFRGGMNSYSNGVFNGGVNGITSTDRAARYQHCVISNGNNTLTTTIAQPDGTTVSKTVAGSIPAGDLRVELADDNYNPDKHFDANGIEPNSGLYTWHWDNVQVFAAAGTPIKVDGACGPANGVAVSVPPAANLCASGMASAVTGTGPWNWTCAGSGGGTTASCSAPKAAGGGGINGSCGPANGTTSATSPTNLCATGTPNGPFGWSGTVPGPWSWDCNGSGGGTSVKCSAAR